MKRGNLFAVIGITITLVLFTGSAPAAALRLFGAEAPGSPQPPDTANSQPAENAISAFTTDAEQGITNSCRQYADHQYEVCFAYIFNISLADLVPYYKYVHSSNESLAKFVSYRLGSRYVDKANQQISNRVASWPSGNLEVSAPKIRILSVHASLTTNTATLYTLENWQVYTGSGHVIYSETNAPHTITMKRVPSYLLHKWVVSEIY